MHRRVPSSTKTSTLRIGLPTATHTRAHATRTEAHVLLGSTMDVGESNTCPSSLQLNHEQVEAAAPAGSSSWRRSSSSRSSYVGHNKMISKVEESDNEDLFTVPEVVEAAPSIPRDAITAAIKTSTTCTSTIYINNPEVQSSRKRHRGRNPVDMEYRRLKRLLRNRVSAQQARERKKVYVNDLESRARELQEINSKLEKKVSTLTNENAMLRKVLMNSRPKIDDQSSEQKQRQLGKS